MKNRFTWASVSKYRCNLIVYVWYRGEIEISSTICNLLLAPLELTELHLCLALLPTATWPAANCETGQPRLQRSMYASTRNAYDTAVYVRDRSTPWSLRREAGRQQLAFAADVKRRNRIVWGERVAFLWSIGRAGKWNVRDLAPEWGAASRTREASIWQQWKPPAAMNLLWRHYIRRASIVSLGQLRWCCCTYWM
jgi:hypothetical protein